MPTDCFLHTLKWQCALCLPLHGLFFALEACDCVERIDDKDQLLILQSPILYHIRGLQPSALYSCHHIYFGPRVCFRVGQWHRYPMDRNNSVRPIDAIMSAATYSGAHSGTCNPRMRTFEDLEYLNVTLISVGVAGTTVWPLRTGRRLSPRKDTFVRNNNTSSSEPAKLKDEDRYQNAGLRTDVGLKHISHQ